MLANLKLNLDSGSKIFQPGTEILGTVNVSSLGSVPLAGLNVTLIGTMQTLQVQGPYSELQESKNFCEESVSLVPLDSSATSANQKSFPFVLMIPGNAPPSIVVNIHNRISYKLRANIPSAHNVKAAERNVYMVTTVDLEKASSKMQESVIHVPLDSRDSPVKYGGPVPAKYEKSYDVLSRGAILLEVEFPTPGIYTDDKLKLPIRLTFFGELPRLTLRSLNVTIAERTKLVTKGKENSDRKHHTIFTLKERIDVTGMPSLDLTDMVEQRAAVPDLAPNFDRDMIGRSYTWSVTASFYKGLPSSPIPDQMFHVNCHSGLLIYGKRENLDILPSYSRSY